MTNTPIKTNTMKKLRQGIYESDKEYKARYVSCYADEHRLEQKHNVKAFGKRHPHYNTDGKTGEYEKWYQCEDCGFKTVSSFVDYPSIAEIFAEGIYQGKISINNYT